MTHTYRVFVGVMNSINHRSQISILHQRDSTELLVSK